MLSKTIRTALKDFLIPPGYLRMIAEARRARTRQHVDPRRFWNREDVPSLDWNVPLFRSAALPSTCITFGNESREAVRLHGECALDLPADQESVCRIAVAAGDDGAGIEGDLEGRPAFRMEAIKDGRWQIVSFPVPAGGGILGLRTTGAAGVAVSHPVVTPAPRAGTAPGMPRTVIVIILDSIAFDLLERYGKEREGESAIHRFFEHGTVCTNAFSQAEWTYPSLYSILTSQPTFGHGCFERYLGAGLHEDQEGTLPQEMVRRGYVSMGFSTSKMYHPAYNAHLGFHRFFYQSYGTALSFPVITDQAIAHLESHRGCRNFMFLDYIDLHSPWFFNTETTDAGLSANRICDPNLEFDRLFSPGRDLDPVAIDTLSRRCVARIRDVDLSLSRIFAYLENAGLADDAVVLLTADHGDLFRSGRQPLLCRTRTHVPFMVRAPGVGRHTIDDFVSAGVDIMPTLLHLVDGTKPGPLVQGLVLPPVGPGRDHVVIESAYENSYQATVRSHKFVYHFQCAYQAGADRKISLTPPSTAMLFECADEPACIDVKDRYRADWDWHHSKLVSHLSGVTVVEPWLRQFVGETP